MNKCEWMNEWLNECKYINWSSFEEKNKSKSAFKINKSDVRINYF